MTQQMEKLIELFGQNVGLMLPLVCWFGTCLVLLLHSFVAIWFMVKYHFMGN